MSNGVLIKQSVVGGDALHAGLARLLALAESPRSIYEAIATYGEQSTRVRFKRETAPDGQKWKPSQRVRKHGGMTLQLKARLLRDQAARPGGR